MSSRAWSPLNQPSRRKPTVFAGPRLYKLGGNAAGAVATLQEATKLPLLPDTAIGPVWAELADALLAADRPAPEVLKAFNDAMASAGSVSTTVRYRLARQFADGRDPRAGAIVARTLPANRPAGSAGRRTSAIITNEHSSSSHTTSFARPTIRKPRSGCASN